MIKKLFTRKFDKNNIIDNFFKFFLKIVESIQTMPPIKAKDRAPKY